MSKGSSYTSLQAQILVILTSRCVKSLNCRTGQEKMSGFSFLRRETQLEMLNCAQGAFVTRAASLAKAQHRASRAADEREGLRGAGPPPADAVPRGKRGRGGKR